MSQVVCSGRRMLRMPPATPMSLYHAAARSLVARIRKVTVQFWFNQDQYARSLQPASHANSSCSLNCRLIQTSDEICYDHSPQSSKAFTRFATVNGFQRCGLSNISNYGIYLLFHSSSGFLNPCRRAVTDGTSRHPRCRRRVAQCR